MTKWTARLGLAGLAVIAAVVSYLHCLPVVQAADGTGRVAYLVPLLADLLIAVSTANILDAQHGGERWPRLSVASAGVGVVVTLGMNVAAGNPHLWPPWLVNAWPPVAFVLALESFAGHVRRGRETASPATDDQGRPLTTQAALAALVASDSERNLAAVLNVKRHQVQAWKRPLATVAACPPAGAPPSDSVPAPAGARFNGHGAAHGD